MVPKASFAIKFFGPPSTLAALADFKDWANRQHKKGPRKSFRGVKCLNAIWFLPTNEDFDVDNDIVIIVNFSVSSRQTQIKYLKPKMPTIMQFL